VQTENASDAVGSEVSVLGNSRVLISNFNAGQYQELIHGRIVTHTFDQPAVDNMHAFRCFFSLEDEIIVKTQNSFFYNLNKSWSTQTKHNFKQRFYSISENEVWGLRNDNGLQTFTLENQKLAISEVLFNDYVISTCYAANNGTMYLGTFYGGIIVIPKKTLQPIYSSKGGKIRDLTAVNDTCAYVSQMGKGIVLINSNSATTVVAEKQQFFDKLFWNNRISHSTTIINGLHYDNAQYPSNTGIPKTHDALVLTDES